MQQKISYWRFSFETFFIVSMDLQWLKFLKNTWDVVKLLHLNKVTFSVIKFIKGVYPLHDSRNFLMDFGRVSFENTSQSYVAFDNTNLQTIIIASYLTEPDDYWMKVTKISRAMIQYWEVSVNIWRDCHRTRQVKETLTWEIL